MSTIATRRARRRAHRILAYRAWASAPATASIPPLSVLTDPSIHRFERDRELRLAQNGIFTTPAARGIASPAAA